MKGLWEVCSFVAAIYLTVAIYLIAVFATDKLSSLVLGESLGKGAIMCVLGIGAGIGFGLAKKSFWVNIWVVPVKVGCWIFVFLISGAAALVASGLLYKLLSLLFGDGLVWCAMVSIYIGIGSVILGAFSGFVKFGPPSEIEEETFRKNK